MAYCMNKLLTLLTYLFSFFIHLNHPDVKILMLFSHVPRMCSRQIDVIFFLIPKAKCRILFSAENKEIISKCWLLKCLLNTTNVNTKQSLTRVMISSYFIRKAKIKIYLCIRTVSSGSFLFICSRLSLSRPRLSRINAYLEVKIWSPDLPTGDKILWKRREIAP